MSIPLSPIDDSGLQQKFDEWIGFIERSHHGSNPRINHDGAFTPLTKPLAESRVALVTTAGAHLTTQEPFHVETVAGDSSHRILPDDLDPADLRFTHTHYDTSSAEEDPNCVFPIDRLHELVERGRIGEASPVHIGMMGFNPDPTPIKDELAPRVAGILADAEVDVAIMVPGWPMCHRSVGLVQGTVEASGIPTVTVSMRPDVTYGVRVPRAAYARFPHGNPFGEPHHPEQHHLVFEALLQLLEDATEPTFVELPFRWRRWKQWL